MIASGVLTLACGTIGVWQYKQIYSDPRIGTLTRALSASYTAMQMLVLHTPHFEHGTNYWLELAMKGVFTLGATTLMVFWTRVRREIHWMLHRNVHDHTRGLWHWGEGNWDRSPFAEGGPEFTGSCD